jgi:putative transposase
VSVTGKQFYTAAELAALGLAGLGRHKRRINERAIAEQWALRTDAKGMPLAKPRTGRGGGLEYHVLVLPSAARLDLAKRGLVAGRARH